MPDRPKGRIYITISNSPSYMSVYPRLKVYIYNIHITNMNIVLQNIVSFSCFNRNCILQTYIIHDINV